MHVHRLDLTNSYVNLGASHHDTYSYTELASFKRHLSVMLNYIIYRIRTASVYCPYSTYLCAGKI